MRSITLKVEDSTYEQVKNRADQLNLSVARYAALMIEKEFPPVEVRLSEVNQVGHLEDRLRDTQNALEEAKRLARMESYQVGGESPESRFKLVSELESECNQIKLKIQKLQLEGRAIA